MNMIERREKLKAQLKDKKYRDAFVSEHIDTGIPFQIRALRKQRKLTQRELSEITSMAQERISVAENPNYSRFNIKTLKRIASAFEVALIVRFVPISELVKWELNLSSEALEAVSFEDDPYFKPLVTKFVAQEEVVIAGAGIGSCCYPEPKAMGKLIDLKDARQKSAIDKMDEYQKEMDRPLLQSLAGLKQ